MQVAVLTTAVAVFSSVACAPAPSPTGTGGVWSPAQSMLGPRQETAVVAIENEMFVLGGIDANLDIVATVEAYDATTDRWREVAPLPRALHHANAAVVDGEIVIAGGLTGLSFAGNQSVYLYSPGADTWRRGAPMPPATERGGAGVAVVDGGVFILGGYADGRALATVSRYRPALDAWDEMPPLPAARDHVLAFAVDREIFVVGGRNGSISSHEATVFVFHVDEETWREVAPMPTSRAGAAGALGPDGLFYVVGGEGNPNAPSGVFPHTEAFDPAGNVWTRLLGMQTPRHGMGAVFIERTLFVPGGAPTEGFDATSTHERFVPPPP